MDDDFLLIGNKNTTFKVASLKCSVAKIQQTAVIGQNNPNFLEHKSLDFFFLLNNLFWVKLKKTETVV